MPLTLYYSQASAESSPDATHERTHHALPSRPPLLPARLPPLSQKTLGFIARLVVQSAEVGQVLLFKRLQRREQLPVGPGSHLLNKYAESVREIRMLEPAELLHPREVREDLLEVPIQSEEDLVDG